MKISDDISIVIPTYNGSKFIEETIKSIFLQTLLPREIIIVDDVSTDNTPAIIKEIQANSPIPLYFIKLDRNSGGPAKPINVGIKKATGDYIAICEQDDCMLPNKIEMFNNFIKLEPNIQFVISRYNVLIYDDVKDCQVRDDSFSEFDKIKKTCLEHPFYCFDKDNAYKMAINKCFAVSLSNMFFSKKLWKTIRGFNESLKRIVDRDFLIRVTYKYRIGWIDTPLWIFRRHRESTIYNTSNKIFANELIEICKREIRKSNLSFNVKAELYYQLFLAYKRINKDTLAKYYFFKTLLYNPKDSMARYLVSSYLERNYFVVYKFIKNFLELINK